MFPRLVLIIGLICIVTQSRAQWRQVKTQETRGVASGQVLKNNGYLFLATNGGLYRTEDVNTKWKQVNPMQFGVGVDESTRYMYTSGNLLLLDKKVYSSDNGQTWDTVNIPDSLNYSGGAPPQPDLVLDGNFYFKTTKGPHAHEPFLYRSDDRGETWVRDSTRILEHNTLYMVNGEVLLIRKDSQTLFVTNDGENFRNISAEGFVGGHIRGDSNDFYAFNNSERLFRTAVKHYDAQANKWVSIFKSLGEQDRLVANFNHAKDTLFTTLVTQNSDRFQYFWSGNEGQTWHQMDLSNIPLNIVNSFSIIEDGIWLAATFDGPYISNDQGNSWRKASKGIYKKAIKVNSYKDKVIATSIGQMFDYQPSSENFEELSIPVKSAQPGSIQSSRGILYTNHLGFYTRNMNPYYKTSLQASWQAIKFPLSDSGEVTGVAHSGSYFALSKRYGNYGEDTTKVYLSVDTGQSWRTLKFRSDVLFLKRFRKGLLLALERNLRSVSTPDSSTNDKPKPYFYYSNDNGQTWSPLNEQLATKMGKITMVKVFSRDKEIVVFPGVDFKNKTLDSLFVYRDGKWIASRMAGLEQVDEIRNIQFYDKDSNLIMLTNQGFMTSSDWGRNWKKAMDYPSQFSVYDLGGFALKGDHLVLGSKAGLYQRKNISLGVEEKEGKTSPLTVYPNPANGQVWLQMASQRSETFNGRLINTRGKVIKQFKWNTNPGQSKKRLALPVRLPTGIYQVILNSDHEQYIRKVLAQ